MADAIDADPWAVVARQVEEYLGFERPYGIGPFLARAIDRARRGNGCCLVTRSGLTVAEFANRCGTSASRMSTYRSGSVIPSAALLVRMRRVAAPVAGGG